MDDFCIDLFGSAKVAQQIIIAEKKIQHRGQKLRLGRAAAQLRELESLKRKEALKRAGVARNAG